MNSQTTNKKLTMVVGFTLDSHKLTVKIVRPDAKFSDRPANGQEPLVSDIPGDYLQALSDWLRQPWQAWPTLVTPSPDGDLR